MAIKELEEKQKWLNTNFGQPTKSVIEPIEEWQPMFLPKYGHPYPSAPKLIMTKEQKKIILKTLINLGVKSEEAIIQIGGRYKTFEELTNGDAWNIIELNRRKGIEETKKLVSKF